MNVFHSYDGTDIFILWKMKWSIQLGFASLNRTFNLSPHENICTIALITIHYLYNIAEKYSMIYYYYLCAVFNAFAREWTPGYWTPDCTGWVITKQVNNLFENIKTILFYL